MTYEKLEEQLINGKVGMLPNYTGYFYWDYYRKCPYMLNGDYKTYEIDELKTRNDWFYII